MASRVSTATRAAVRSEKDQDNQNPDLLGWCDSFASDAAVPVAIGAGVADTMHDWGIARESKRARSLAVVQTAWLLANGHIGDSVSVYLRLQVVRRELTLAVGDDGITALAPLPGDRLRSLRRGWMYTYTQTGTGGRELVFIIKVCSDWTVRLTWLPGELGALHHPPFSFEPCDTRQHALARARSFLRSIGSDAEGPALLAVHVQGPGQAEIDEWELVGAPQPEGAAAA